MSRLNSVNSSPLPNALRSKYDPPHSTKCWANCASSTWRTRWASASSAVSTGISVCCPIPVVLSIVCRGVSFVGGTIASAGNGVRLTVDGSWLSHARRRNSNRASASTGFTNAPERSDSACANDLPDGDTPATSVPSGLVSPTSAAIDCANCELSASIGLLNAGLCVARPIGPPIAAPSTPPNADCSPTSVCQGTPGVGKFMAACCTPDCSDSSTPSRTAPDPNAPSSDRAALEPSPPARRRASAASSPAAPVPIEISGVATPVNSPAPRPPNCCRFSLPPWARMALIVSTLADPPACKPAVANTAFRVLLNTIALAASSPSPSPFATLVVSFAVRAATPAGTAICATVGRAISASILGLVSNPPR